MRLPSLDLWSILDAMLARKSNWPSLERVTKREFFAFVHDFEARVTHAVFAAHLLEVFFPALAIGWIGEHEVEFLRGEGVVREGGVFGAAEDVFGVLAFALQDHVGFADGVGFGVDFLSVEEGLHLLVALFGDGNERLFGDGEHAAGAAGAIV